MVIITTDRDCKGSPCKPENAPLLSSIHWSCCYSLSWSGMSGNCSLDNYCCVTNISELWLFSNRTAVTLCVGYYPIIVTQTQSYTSSPHAPASQFGHLEATQQAFKTILPHYHL